MGLLGASNHNTKTRQAMYVRHNTDAGLSNDCCSGKAISMKHSECVSVALVTQHVMHTCHLSSAACPDVQYYSTLPH
jgi:hypothetical protein